MPYAIVRVAKIKSLGSLSGLSRHHMRTALTPNADPTAPEAIRVLVGSANPYQDVKARLPEKVRKNGVLAMEHLLTASPEYFRPGNPAAAGTYDKTRMEDWVAKAVEFLQERYGDNLASAVLHLDEATPHVQAMVVPRREDGKLDAAKLFNPEALRRLQDDYADKMRPLGLERGIEGSKAKHERIKAHYGRVNAPTPPIPEVQTPTPKLRDRKLVEHIPFTTAKAKYDAAEARADAQAGQRAKEVSERSQALEKALPALLDKASVTDARQKADKSREKALAGMRAAAARVREIPLADVMERLGCKRDPSDPKNNWKTPAGRITITGQKFYNHDLGEGGGGAIDLVKSQLGCDYKQAVAWLGGEVGKDAAIGAAMAAAKEEAIQAVAVNPPSPVPTPSLDPRHIDRVRRYLVETRKLPPRLVDWCLDKGKVFAATWTTRNGGVLVNAAFALDTSGVELRGTAGDFHGVRGKKGVFAIATGADAKKSVFVESSIEALSYFSLAQERGEVVRIISTTGSSSEKLLELVAKERAAGREVVPAFNHDQAGAMLATKVEQAGGSARELPPLDCNDWNEYIQLQADPEQFAERIAELERQQTWSHGLGFHPPSFFP
jgi:hypothetical protein